jgi:uncharacterized membrane protein
MAKIKLDTSLILIVIGVILGILQIITGLIGLIKVGRANPGLQTCNCVDDVNGGFAVGCLSAIVM